MSTVADVLHDYFRENVRTARVTRGLTQQDVADKLGVSRAYVAEVEGGRHTPSLDLVERFAAVLKIEGHQLLLPPKKFSVAS